jgi:DNA primase
MANLIPEATITQVREATNIVDIIGQYTPLTKKGRQYNGSCAFHEDRNPSLFVDEEKQVFNCFSCGRSGSVVQFLMDKEGWSFPETIINLAEQADIAITGAQTHAPVDTHLQELLRLQDEAQRLYHHILMNTSSGSEALKYVHEQRALPDEALTTFKIGYAPTNNALLSVFQEQNVPRQTLLDSQLFIEDDQGTLRDRFAGRLIFPLRNERGQVVGFSGRSLKQGDKIKYMNSPESRLFNKSKLLFNYDLARAQLKQTREVIVFEGFMDVIAAHMAGHPIGVASMGTALTPEQVQMLNRQVDTIYLAYDGDEAGQLATRRAIDVIQKVNAQLTIGIVQLPDALDPDEVRLRYGIETLQQALKQRIQTPLEFLIQAARQGKNLSQEADYLRFIQEVLQILQTASPVEQDLHLNRLSEEFGTSKLALAEQLAHLKKQSTQTSSRQDRTQRQYANDVVETTAPSATGNPQEKITRIERAEQALVMALLKDRQIYAELQAQPDFQFVHPIYQTLMIMAGIYHQQHPEGYRLVSFLDLLQKPELNQRMMQIDRLFGDVTILPEAINDYKHAIMREAPVVSEIEATRQALQEATRQQDTAKMLQLTTQLVQLKKQQQRGQ